MKTVSLIQQSHAQYPEVISFANQVYERELGSGAAYKPTWFFTLFADDTVRGCLGLNRTVVSRLFRNDIRLRQWQSTHRGQMCDQAFFAVDRVPFGVPALICAAAAFAETVGIRYIVFAGINATCRTIDKLGFKVRVIGETRIDIVPDDMQQTLSLWQQSHQPVTCVLDTAGSQEICTNVFHRHHKRVALDSTLSKTILPPAKLA